MSNQSSEELKLITDIILYYPPVFISLTHTLDPNVPTTRVKVFTRNDFCVHGIIKLLSSVR